MGFNHIAVASTTHGILKATSLKPVPSVGMVGKTYIPMIGGKEKEPPIAQIQLKGQPVIISSWWLPPTSVYWFILSHLRALICLFHHLGVLYTVTKLCTEKYVDEWTNMVGSYIRLFHNFKCLLWIRSKLPLRIQQETRLTTWGGEWV